MIAHTTQQFLEGHPVFIATFLGGVLLLLIGCISWAFVAHYHRQRLRFEMLLTDLLADFSDAGTAEIDGKIRRWLEVIGRFFQVDRVAFSALEEDGSGLRVIHDFAREGIPRLDRYLYTEDAPWMFQALYAGEVLNVRRVPRDIPRNSRRDYDHFRRLRLKSLLVVPLKTRESGTYLVSFGYVRTYGQWAQDTHLRLRLVCEVFARALTVAGAMEVEKRLINAVQEEQQRMNSILREFRGVVWEIRGKMHDPDARVVYISENVVDLVGYTSAEWTAEPQFWLKVLHPDDRDASVATADQLLEKGGFAVKQFRWIRKGGGTVWLEAHMVVTKDATGRAIGLRGVILDISRRKQTEEAYEESQRLIRRIAETMPSILYLYDSVENRNLFCNRRIQTVLGYTEAEVQAMGHELLQQLIHPDDKERVAAHGRKLMDLADEEVMELEYRLRARNGQYRWLFGRETVFTREADGKPRSILGVAHDVTSRRLDQMALRQSEELNRAVIDSLSSLIVILDQDGRVLAANRAWQTRWAKTRRNLAVGAGDPVLGPAGMPTGNHAASTATLRKGLEKVLKGPATDFRMEYEVRGEDGLQWFEITVHALRRDAGGAVVCHTDITARKHAEHELQKSHEQVRQLAGRLISAQEEERRRIAQELHDDLSQRLAAQAISLSNLQRDFESGEKASLQAAIEKIRSAAVTIADDVRAISHELHPPVLMFAGLPACLESLCREFTANCDFRVNFVLEEDPGRVSSDVALCLYRSAQEALRNVSKHAQANSVTVTLTKAPQGIVMRIEDDGVGVSVKNGNGRPGLGLISLRERAHSLRGSFSVTARTAGGTCLEVGIPGD